MGKSAALVQGFYRHLSIWRDFACLEVMQVLILSRFCKCKKQLPIILLSVPICHFREKRTVIRV